MSFMVVGGIASIYKTTPGGAFPIPWLFVALIAAVTSKMRMKPAVGLNRLLGRTLLGEVSGMHLHGAMSRPLGRNWI
jgi:hypothetical protein